MMAKITSTWFNHRMHLYADSSSRRKRAQTGEILLLSVLSLPLSAPLPPFCTMKNEVSSVSSVLSSLLLHQTRCQ